MDVHLWHSDGIILEYVMAIVLELQPAGGELLKPIAYSTTRMLQLFWI